MPPVSVTISIYESRDSRPPVRGICSVVRAVITRRLAVQSLDQKRIDFYGSGLAEHLHGKDQPIKIFFTYQDALDSLQRATFDPNPVAAFQQGMGLEARTAFDGSADCIDLRGRNSSRLPAVRYDGMYTRCRHDVRPALKTAIDKDIARKERQRKQLGSILPPAGDRIEREQGLESLIGENVSHRFLMLVARIKRIPSARGFHLIDWTTKHIAPPCDLQEVPHPC
jgi:hypothetical protein